MKSARPRDAFVAAKLSVVSRSLKVARLLGVTIPVGRPLLTITITKGDSWVKYSINAASVVCSSNETTSRVITVETALAAQSSPASRTCTV